MTIQQLAQQDEDIRSYLENWVYLLRSKGVQAGKAYICDMDFVLRHGQAYRMAAEQPNILMQKKRCFLNSYLAAVMEKQRYCEGWAIAPNVPMAVHHAWNLNDAGEVVDHTWAPGGAYFGVKFSIRRAAEAIVTSNSGSVLDDWMRGHPILQEPWQGE